jgi:hypothetical protein
MVTATVLILIFSPLFYVLLEKVSGKGGRRAPERSTDDLLPKEDQGA